MSVPNDSTSNLPLGICVLPEQPINMARSVSYPRYIDEILQHAGLAYQAIALDVLAAALPRLKVLLTVGEYELPADLKSALSEWLRGGGCWLSIGGVCGMSEMLGAGIAPPAYVNWHRGLSVIGEGYLVAEQRDHPVIAHVQRPLHFFLGLALNSDSAKVLATSQDRHGRSTEQPLIIEKQIGQGRALLIAADVTGTIVRLQQGVAVTRDGVSAPDGTAPVADSVLKTDDGQVVDWIFDRELVPGVEGLQLFLTPIADAWREIVLRSIFYLAREGGVSLPLLWLYPRQLPAIGHISHDTDGNDPAKARMLLETLKQAGIKSTWCTILPGYDRALTDQIRAAGHELAMHYDAMTEGLDWGETQFDRQHRGLVELFGGERPTSNKNHYLRWQGDTELWDWCVKRGIHLDQSKGASKTGEAGFNFGTCHPYRPVRFEGEFIDILELATPTQDLEVFAPSAILDPLLASVKRNHGVLHLLFHPAHIDKPAVADAILSAVKRGKENGLEWWTAKQIHEWEFARRGVRWSKYTGRAVSVSADTTLHDATVLWLRAGTRGSRAGFGAWGFEFGATTLTLQSNTEMTVEGV
jgi:peptidoglycan/xylan/chitin deacetylase (PgdA/CDA1 family)